MNFSKKNNKQHSTIKEMVSNTKTTILILLFTFSILGVKAQIRGVNTSVPIKTNVKTVAKKPQKIKGTLIAPNGKHYFYTEKRYFRYSKDNGLEKIANIASNWGGIPDNIDGVFVNTTNKKAYFFKGSKYNRYDFKKNALDNKELAISRFWKGVPNDIDAVTNHPNGKIYFFRGNTYYRYDPKLKKVDKTALISKNWKGVPNDVAAAFLHKNGKIYFFKGNKYYRYSITSAKVDKSATVGKDGWKELDFNKKNFTKKIPKPVVAEKDNIRLKVTLTRIKSVQARDSDDIADFLLDQTINYKANSKDIKAIKSTMKRYRYYGKNKFKDYQVATNNRLIRSEDDHFHIREGDENHYINNSLVFEITSQEIKDKRAEFNIYTDLGESDGRSNAGWLGIPYLGALFYSNPVRIKAIATKHFIDVNIYEVLDYLQNPSNSKYGKSYFNGGRNGDMHEYGAFGDVMWFKKGSNNSLIGHLEFGDNNKETYVRFYYRFELVD